MIIYDASDCVAGRLASVAAKQLLKGNPVSIVNAESAVVSGDQKHNIRKFKEKIDRGDPYHGPFYPRMPDQMLKRFVRGMLPKSPRGREALKNLKVFLSVPSELEGKPFSRPDEARNELKGKYMALGELATKVGARKTWDIQRPERKEPAAEAPEPDAEETETPEGGPEETREEK